MKDHPEELLAAFVDGELREQDARAVEDHLAACQRCAGEVALARRAATALGALEEVPAPLGLGTRAVQQARPARPWAERLQWALGIGAAAALIAVGVVVVTHSEGIQGAGDGGAAGPIEAEDDAGGGEAPADGAEDGPAYVESDRDYSSEDLQAVVLEGDSVTAYTAETSERRLAASGVEQASRCVERAGLAAEEDAQLIRLERARFEGTPAYIVLFETETSVNAWAVEVESCRILYVASAQA